MTWMARLNRVFGIDLSVCPSCMSFSHSEGELGVDPRLHALSIREAALEVTEYAACLVERQSVRVVAAFFEPLRRATA